MSLALRHPTLADGRPVWSLVRDTGVLDLNSVYAYCALFRHFPDNCVVAEAGDQVVGFVTGHRIPARPDVLFVWQVGVGQAARGQGLATRMIRWILDQPVNHDLRAIETTVTPDNGPSRALFHSLARKLGTSCEVSPGLTSEHLGADHAPEELFRIGPISRSHP